jgi:3-deoxy-manno-octulosonate cytidylyltransferase (CMP-KDO synthetase)
MRPRCVAVVPARWGSSRFPGKPLAPLGGRPMVVHVLERARAAFVFDAVWAATDDARIADAVQAAGFEAVLTSADHTTGTERVAEAVSALTADAIVVNVQGDEPLVPPALLADLVEVMRAEPGLEMATAACAGSDAADFASPHVVKVVVDAQDDALYFSRAPIPCPRSAAPSYLRHVGVYAFRAAALRRLVTFAPGRLEAIEGLEQLRALENGMRIRVRRTEHAPIGVDTPDDLKAVASRLHGA